MITAATVTAPDTVRSTFIDHLSKSSQVFILQMKELIRLPKVTLLKALS